MSNLFVSQKPWSEQTFEENSGGDLVTSLIELRKLRAQLASAKKALEECARPWSSPPGLMPGCFNAMGEEFQRRLDIAASTLKDITP